MDKDYLSYLTELVQKHDQGWKDRLAVSEARIKELEAENREARELLREALNRLTYVEDGTLCHRIRVFLGIPIGEPPR